MKKVGGIAGWVDDRTGAAKGVGYLMKKVFPTTGPSCSVRWPCTP